MRIFLVPCTYTCLNMGDVAMLQVAVARLGVLWPGAWIDVPTKDPEALKQYCPSVHPVPQGDWFADHQLLGQLHDRVPHSLSEKLIDAKWLVRGVLPSLEVAAIDWKLRVRRSPTADFRAAVQAQEAADLVAVSGTGGITDTFPTYSLTVLGTLVRAIRDRKPTAMFSHGLGPLRNQRLFRRAASILPRVDLIALRERRAGAALLERMKVPGDRVVITGDDAVETAYRARSQKPGTGIGVNVRIGSAAGLEDGALAALGSPLREFAREKRAPLLAIPIARQQSIDALAIEEILAGGAGSLDGGRELDTPEKVIAQVSRCRVVVTGAYHAAVFALSQGIPAICLARSAYYVDKFLGLADMFGKGCETVLLDSENAVAGFGKTLERVWESADELRKPLLASASQQVETSWQAYRRVGELASTRGLAPSPAPPAVSAGDAEEAEEEMVASRLEQGV